MLSFIFLRIVDTKGKLRKLLRHTTKKTQFISVHFSPNAGISSFRLSPKNNLKGNSGGSCCSYFRTRMTNPFLLSASASLRQSPTLSAATVTVPPFLFMAPYLTCSVCLLPGERSTDSRVVSLDPSLSSLIWEGRTEKIHQHCNNN